jgi:hypothetical protein
MTVSAERNMLAAMKSIGGMESATALGVKPSRAVVAGFWISTVLLALQMSFTAYAQLRLPQVAAAFAHLGFPAWFRVELSWAKLAGAAALLVPAVPARLKEWAYAGFAITLVSALMAHIVAGDDVDAWGWAAGTAVLWCVSYFFWSRMQTGVPEGTA